MSPEEKQHQLKKIISLIKNQIYKVVGKRCKIDISYDKKEICLLCDNYKQIEKAHFQFMKKLKNLRICKRQFYRSDYKTMFSYQIKSD